MRRDWQSERLEGGDEEAHRMATALAQIADADFIEKVVQLKAALDAFGGEMFIAAFRAKLNAEGKPAQDGEPGTYETLGYRWGYDHHAKLTHDPAQPNAKLDEPASLDGLGDEPEPAQIERLGDVGYATTAEPSEDEPASEEPTPVG